MSGGLTVHNELIVHGTLTVDGAHQNSPIILMDAPIIQTNAALGNYFKVQTISDRTLGSPTNAIDGQVATWRFKNYGSSSITLTLSTGVGGFRFGTDITGTTPTSAGAADYITAVYNLDEDLWDVRGYIKGFSTTDYQRGFSESINQWLDDMPHPTQHMYMFQDTINILGVYDAIVRRIGYPKTLTEDINLISDGFSALLLHKLQFSDSINQWADFMPHPIQYTIYFNDTLHALSESTRLRLGYSKIFSDNVNQFSDTFAYALG